MPPPEDPPDAAVVNTYWGHLSNNPIELTSHIMNSSLKSTLGQVGWRSKLVTPVEAPQQDQECVQRLRTDSQRHHPQSLETLLQVHTSHLQPDEVPLGVGKLANETLSRCCPSHLTKDAPQKMVQKGIFGKCCLWRSQLHRRKVLNGSLTNATCPGVDGARDWLAAQPPPLIDGTGLCNKR